MARDVFDTGATRAGLASTSLTQTDGHKMETLTVVFLLHSHVDFYQKGPEID